MLNYEAGVSSINQASKPAVTLHCQVMIIWEFPLDQDRYALLVVAWPVADCKTAVKNICLPQTRRTV